MFFFVKFFFPMHFGKTNATHLPVWLGFPFGKLGSTSIELKVSEGFKSNDKCHYLDVPLEVRTKRWDQWVVTPRNTPFMGRL